MILNLPRLLAVFGAAVLAPLAWPADNVLALAAFFVPVVLIASSTARLPIGTTSAALAGLVADSISGGPLGHWALVYGAAAVVAARLRATSGGEDNATSRAPYTALNSGAPSRLRTATSGIVAFAALMGALIAAAAIHVAGAALQSGGLHVVWPDMVQAVTACTIALGVTVIINGAAALTARRVSGRRRARGAA